MENTGKQQPRNGKLPIYSVMLSLPEVGRFGGWICDNWKRTSYDRWQNIHTYEMIDTIEELYERFKSNEAIMPEYIPLPIPPQTKQIYEL